MMANGKGLGAGRYTASDRRCATPDGYRAIPMIQLNAKGVRWSPVARLDLYAVGLSTLCLLHCLALPVLVALMPMAAQAAESELVHRALVVAAVPVSLWVIWKTRPVRSRSPLPAVRSCALRIFGTGCDGAAGVASTASPLNLVNLD